jgi:hypothetical protein
MYNVFMSTVLYKNGLRIYVNAKENEHKGRPHCHIKKGDAEASVDFMTGKILHNNGKFSRGDMKVILAAIAELQIELLLKWEEYHGEEEN